MNEIINEINSNDNIVVLCHVYPDGDAMGSSLAMYNYLKNINKNVDIVINDAPKKFSYLNGFNDIKNDSDKKYDLAIVVDTATKERVNCSHILDNSKKVLVIDHHISNEEYGDVNYVEKCAACAQLLYKLFKTMNYEIDKNIGEALYTGILTDSGGFQYFEVNKETFEAAIYLSNYINIADIYKKALGTITKEQFELKKIAISHLEFLCNNRIGYSYINEDEVNKCGANINDCGILVNIAREIEGVYVSIFTRYFNEGVRLSFRSSVDFIDFNSILKKYGGGGHKAAAGITLSKDMNYENIIKEIIKEVEDVINEWDINNKQTKKLHI